jgi:hypothetical protein
MRSQRSRAAFEPISPDVDIAALVDSTPNFEYAHRIDCHSIDDLGLEKFEKMVLGLVILGGKPLVIGGFNERLNGSIFSAKWLRSRYSKKSKWHVSPGKAILTMYSSRDCSKFSHKD